MGRRTNRSLRATAAQSARERAEQLRAQQASEERRRRLIVGGVAALGAAAVVVVAIVLGTRGGSSSGGHQSRAVSLAAQAGQAAPPWPRPADTVSRADQAGLAVTQSEGTAVHFHVHLDIYVNGSKEPVPAGLGLDTSSISELHTHDASGVLHVEAPAASSWVLAQLFDEWNVRLTATQLGQLAADSGHSLRAYVNGKAVSGNPGAIVLQPHQEIALVYGAPGSVRHIPASYAFPAGE